MAVTNRIDGVVMIGEMWYSPIAPDDEGIPIPPSEHPDRSEALYIVAETGNGEHRAAYIPFVRRRGRKTWVMEPWLEEDGDARDNFLEPLRAAWRAAGFGESTHSEQDENG